jgi:hypothetical protein
MKIKLFLGVLTTGAALTMVQVQAQMPDTDYLLPNNLLKNPGFELPGIPISSGFANIPDWNYAPTPVASHSGNDPAWAAGHDGTWAATSMSADADAGVWANQDTGYVLQSGDFLYLSLVAGQNWTYDANWGALPGTLHYQIWETADGGPGDGVIYDGYFTVHNSDSDDGAFNYYAAVIPNSALEPYVGYTIGISIWNSSDTDGTAAGGNGSWIDFDDVFLCSSAGFYTYTTNYDNTITITSYTGPVGGAAVIPSRINGLLVTTIGDSAFDPFLKEDDAPASVMIPDSVTTIEDWAFSENDWLTNVTIGKGVTSIGAKSFVLCFWLSSITVDPANSFYSSVNGILFDKSTNTIIKYPVGIQAGSYTVPKSVTSLGDYAFQDCDCPWNSLTSVYFQGNAPSIGSYAFSYCPVTAYYLPGTTGWDNFAQLTGVPTVLWNPQAQSDASFGVRANQFGFNIIGSSNLVIVVEACTNLANPDWSPVQTNTLNTFVGTNGSSYFSDPAWTN